MLKSKNLNTLRDEVKIIAADLGKKTKSQSKITITLRVEAETHRKLKIAAANAGKTASEISEKALLEYLQRI
jgi:hypothetical protein